MFNPCAGRKIEVLNEALRAKEESPARSKICESERRSMIEAIDNYEGDDPLHPVTGQQQRPGPTRSQSLPPKPYPL
jgi:hypothetical protein